MKKKILDINNLAKKIKIYKKRRKKIVLSHGSFDLIHPGHIDHLRKAKSFGDILIVTITSDKFINKKIQGSYYNQNQRAFFLSNLEIVDFVSIINEPSAIQALNIIKPDLYCKGEEYKKSDTVGNLEKEKKILKKNKIKIKLIGKQIFSSSEIISKNFEKIDDEIKIKISKNKIKKSNLTDSLEKIKTKRILVIGEIIFDKYTNVSMMGVSPKASTLSCSIIKSNYMPGGALATYKFLKQFTNRVDIFSIVNSNLRNLNLDLKKTKNLIYSNEYPKLIKERIVEKDKSGNLKKILTLNHFNSSSINKNLEIKLLNIIKKKISNYDLVILQDFGHGLVTKKIFEMIKIKSKILSVNVQTNSLNYGFNVIGNKVNKSDYFSLDRKELELFSADQDMDIEASLKKLKTKLNAKVGFLTCGDDFSLGLKKNKIFKIKTLGVSAKDTMGAGDIFHAMSSIMSLVQNNLYLSLLISQIAGAIAVKIEGNSDFPKKNQIINSFNFFVNSILKK